MSRSLLENGDPTTYVLVDIDGVLNPFLGWGLSERGFTNVTHSWGAWQLNSDLHAPWLKEISKYAELVWCSSWGSESNVASRHFELPDLPFVKLSGLSTNSGHGTWKLPYVEDFLREKIGKVVWLDDEFQSDASHWASTRTQTLLIDCDPSIGFTELQYKNILAFIK
jgi:hypothetical protein